MSAGFINVFSQMAKNGNLYDNTWNSRSAQFFSVAGDSSIRVWDIRLPRLGLDEFDVNPTSAIKQNPWHHLENNTWKHAIKVRSVNILYYTC